MSTRLQSYWSIWATRVFQKPRGGPWCDKCSRTTTTISKLIFPSTKHPPSLLHPAPSTSLLPLNILLNNDGQNPSDLLRSAFLHDRFRHSSLQVPSPSRNALHLNMDIVLEVFDTFLFDAFWAAAYPGSSSHTTAKRLQDAATTTFSSMREVATGGPQSSTQFFQLEPSRYAYMSAWPRDNIYRQGITLYLITWYAPPSLSP